MDAMYVVHTKLSSVRQHQNLDDAEYWLGRVWTNFRKPLSAPWQTSNCFIISDIKIVPTLSKRDYGTSVPYKNYNSVNSYISQSEPCFPLRLYSHCLSLFVIIASHRKGAANKFGITFKIYQLEIYVFFF